MVSRSSILLSCVLFISFGLQLVGVVSIPVTRKIALSTYGDYQYGVWGYCQFSTNSCSNIRIGYSVNDEQGFTLPSSSRHSLSRLLIVHVVSTGLTFIMFVMSCFTQCGNKGYLLSMLIFSLPCFLLTLLAFLVEILIFINHLDFAGWFMVGAVVLNAVVIVLLCLMRRNLVDKRSAKNEENEDFADESALSHFGIPHSRDDEKLIKPVVRSRSDASTDQASKPERPPRNMTQGFQSSFTNNSYTQLYDPDQNGPRPEPVAGSAAAAAAVYGSRSRRNPDPNAAGSGDQASGPKRYQRQGNGSQRQPEDPSVAPGQSALPAGTYVDGVGNTASNFGPNVVAIPRIRKNPDQLEQEPRTRDTPQATPRVVHNAPVREESQIAIMSYVDPGNSSPTTDTPTKPLPRVPNYSRMTNSPVQMPSPGKDLSARSPENIDAPQPLKFPSVPQSRGAGPVPGLTVPLKPQSAQDAKALPIVPVPGQRSERRVPSGPRPPNFGGAAPARQQQQPREEHFDPASFYKQDLPSRVSLATVNNESGAGTPSLAEIMANQTPLERFMTTLPPNGPGVYAEPPVVQYAYTSPESEAGSEHSHYTSISQRPVASSRPAPNRSDLAIQTNPDFSLGPMANRRRRAGGNARF